MIMICLIEYWKKTGIGISGLTGAVGAGGAEGVYQSMRQTDLDKRLAQIKGEKDKKGKGKRALRHLAYAVGGSIPIVGALTNAKAAMKRYEKEEELSKEIEKRVGKKNSKK
jgi:hypothetical protein